MQLSQTDRLDHRDIAHARQALRQSLADLRRRLAQDQPRATSRHRFRIERLAAAVVEHDRLRMRDVPRDIARDAVGMQLLVSIVDIDRMLGVPEIDPG